MLEALEGREMMSATGLSKLPVIGSRHIPAASTITVVVTNTSAQNSEARAIVGENAGGILAVLTNHHLVIPGEHIAGAPIVVTLNWGDGTIESAALFRTQSGDISVFGSHVYQRPGTYQMTAIVGPAASPLVGTVELLPFVAANIRETVTLNSDGGKLIHAKVRKVTGPVASIPNLGNFPPARNPQLTIARPWPQTALKATILWGDGISSSGLFISNGAGGFDIIGNHEYSHEGSFRVRILITAAYRAGPFTDTIRTESSLVLAGAVPGNIPNRPLSFPLQKYNGAIPID
jgi:hypothetical protein